MIVKLPTFERRNQITSLLMKTGYVQALHLAEYFQVSMETIRKDLLYLEESGVAFKEYGGARLSLLDVEQKLDIRMENMTKKQQIAKAAVSLMGESKIIFIDAGTTCRDMAKFLKTYRQLDIITNSLLVMDVLNDTHHNVLLTGGKKRNKNMSLVGNWCLQAISSVHADICFLGTSGIMDRKGPTSHSYQELEIKQAMIRNSDRTYVLADSDKFQKSGFHTICNWGEIDAIITDSSLPAKLYDKYVKIVPIFVAQEDDDCSLSKDT
jgi:DeoR/GlpR family transcriptional regulator of sugar metabolism